MWFFYNILFGIAYLVLMPSFLLRMRRRGGYRQDFSERFGRYADAKRVALAGGGRIWVHAVSVGEAVVALQFIRSLREARPGARFVISTTTSTGHAMLAERKSADDVLIYFPMDFPWIIRRVVRCINPVALVLMECELWPNLLRALYRAKVPVWVVNGRISQASYKGYRRVRMFFRRAAQWVTGFLVQTDGDAGRLTALGVPPEKLEVTGSVKYDAVQRDDAAEAAARKILIDAGMDPEAPCLVAGSTWPGEEGVILNCVKRLREHFPALQLILVPRHMERRQEVERLVRESGLPYVRRGAMLAGETPPEKGTAPVVLLADTTGELMGYYSVATLVFVGKSLGENHGGQNPIEPAVWGKTVITGPNMENFPGVLDEMLDAEALLQVADARALEQTIQRLLADPDACAEGGRRARALVASRRGAMARSVSRVVGCFLLMLLCRSAWAVPRIVCPDPVFNFGTVGQDTVVEHSFVIENKGDSPLELTDVKGCCGASVKLQESIVEPGTSTVCKVVFALRQYVGNVSKSMYLHNSDPALPIVQFLFSGVVLPSTNSAAAVPAVQLPLAERLVVVPSVLILDVNPASATGPMVRYLALRSSQRLPFQITEIQMPLESMTHRITPLGAHGWRIEIGGLVATSALDGKELRILTDRVETPEVRVPIRVVTRGVQETGGAH
ncbi:MAG TPA: hypothetical protein DCS43_05755 [Verrucomicrobia bacterium]|nr:hypothetical protein [Verrucomicrobiota bacterium]